jgi:urease accessory protein
MPRIILILAAVLLTGTAQAHVGVGDTHGFEHGFMHPISGFDHILAMVAVGLFAAHLGGRALYLVPLSFVTMMSVGGVLAMMGMPLPFVEVGIGLSVVVFGIAVAAGLNLPVAAAMALVGVFAIFHGHAHGTEMPETASGFAYGAGFVVATAALHGLGVGIGLAIGTLGKRYGDRVLRAAGSAVASVGIAILAGYV